MDERTLIITLSEDGEPPKNFWERIIGKWNELSTLQRALLILTSFGSGAGAVVLLKGGEEKVVE